FPNDNPALHGGVSWVCVAVTAPATGERDCAAQGEPDIVVEELEPLGEAVEVVVDPSSARDEDAPVVPPPADDPFTIFVCRLAEVALGVGAPYVAAALPTLLFTGRLDVADPPEAGRALREAAIVDERGVVTEVFAQKVDAWRALLRGTSDDFGACGG